MDGGFLHTLVLTTIPIFVTMDVLGILPIYITLSEGISRDKKKEAVIQSIITAFFVTVVFVLVGDWIFKVLGIKVEDFMIAGGVLLMVFAVIDILKGPVISRGVDTSLGVVPLGTPLLAGPATLTTALVLTGSYGFFPVLLSIIINLVFAFIILFNADKIIRVIGTGGSRAVAKVAALILAAIAVSMIRNGIIRLLGIH
ncbi:MAG: MarC family protein [Nitrospirota bacterium]